MTTTIDLGGTDNTLTLGDLDYLITGTDGNNTLTVGAGNNTLTLGNGNNTFTLGGGTDTLSAGTGNNTVTTNGTGADTITLTNGNNTVTTADGPDRITVGDGLNMITAGNGNDFVSAGNAFDQVATGNGNSTITVGNGVGDTVTVGLGSNTITIGTGSADVVHTGAGNNIVMVSAVAVGPDSILGALTSGDGTGNKLVLTTTGVITVGGVNGFATYQLANGQANTLTLADANFARLPGGVITVLDGNSGDTVNAGALATANAVAIHAGAGSDILTGGAGNDRFFAGVGHATIDGGTGVNTVVYSGAQSAYSISGISGGVFDVTGTTTSDALRHIQFLTFSDGTIAAPCFAEGTRIRTATGETLVEALREGDLVATVPGGEFLAVRWIGRRRVAPKNHPRPLEVIPVRVEKDAFAPGLPSRSLVLSPGHAVFVDDVLIPIDCLVNGASIARAPVDTVTYFHIELERHAVLLAEGLPAESYLDTGNRAAFDNAGAVVALLANFAPGPHPATPCAPLVQAGPILTMVRARLIERAFALGHMMTADAAPLLLSDWGILPLHEGTEGWLHADLPSDMTDVRLASRSSIPAEVLDEHKDFRRLGVAVTEVKLDGQPLELLDARLGAGWHTLERGDDASWRWTDGCAVIATGDARRLSLRLVPQLHYWCAQPPARLVRIGT